MQANGRHSSASQEDAFVYTGTDGDEGVGRWGRYLVYLVSLMLVLAFAWAAYFELDEVTVASGKVIPSSRSQVVEVLEAGILRKINVEEGQHVKQGDVLLELDDSRVGPLYRESTQRWRSLLAQEARLRAQAFGLELEFPETVQEDKSLVQREKQAYNTRRTALEDQLQALENSRVVLQREIDLISPLVKQGVISEVEVLRLRREESTLQRQVAELKANYLAEASSELVRVDSELKQVSEILLAHQEAFKRATVVSPADGIVKDIRFHTIGAVVDSGATIMEIVPVNDEMLVEAYILPSEVAYVDVGQPARVKLSAFDSRRFGELDGIVKLISPDIVMEESQMASSSLSSSVNFEPGHYKILVQITNPGIERAGMRMVPQPGMTATVDILTGQKTVLEYIFRPLENVREALRER
ncbi:hemolysin secretion protein D [Orrella marina]|uniref:Hemolysin secretion protein D n=1 Tax=Orrella marina TaxID=2163011 RepID=A0A2R4XFE6_9BURK|nr:hemolysin secretion protein D [Orrella marina]